MPRPGSVEHPMATWVGIASEWPSRAIPCPRHGKLPLALCGLPWAGKVLSDWPGSWPSRPVHFPGCPPRWVALLGQRSSKLRACRLGASGGSGWEGGTHRASGPARKRVVAALTKQCVSRTSWPCRTRSLFRQRLFVLIGALTSWGSVDQMGVGRVVNVPCGWDGRVGACGQARKRGERPTRQTPAAWVAPLGDAKSRFSWIPVLSASRNLIKTCYTVTCGNLVKFMIKFWDYYLVYF